MDYLEAQKHLERFESYREENLFKRYPFNYPVLWRSEDVNIFIEAAKTIQKEETLKVLANNFFEVELTISSWIKELGLIENWPHRLHPADILEKYIFPQLYDKIKSKKMRMRRGHRNASRQ